MDSLSDLLKKSRPRPLPPPPSHTRWPSGQQEAECRQQAHSGSSPPGGSRGRGPVAELRVAADVAVVAVEACGVLLSTHAALGRHGTALLVHRHV